MEHAGSMILTEKYWINVQDSDACWVGFRQASSSLCERYWSKVGVGHRVILCLFSHTGHLNIKAHYTQSDSVICNTGRQPSTVQSMTAFVYLKKKASPEIAKRSYFLLCKGRNQTSVFNHSHIKSLYVHRGEQTADPKQRGLKYIVSSFFSPCTQQNTLFTVNVREPENGKRLICEKEQHFRKCLQEETDVVHIHYNKKTCYHTVVSSLLICLASSCRW